ncbi:ribonuclease H-like domain-containing protein [Tanacetum coccineum]
MISMRMKKFYKKTGRKLQFDAKEPVGFDKTKVECYNCHKTGHFARECRTKGNQDSRRRDAWNSGNKDKENGRRSGKQEDSKALVTIDGEGVDWTSHSEEEEDYALMACNSSGSDTEVTSCSNECKESYAKLKKLYDAQREQLSDASIEIKAYTQGLKKVEAQLVAHQQGQLWYEEKIRFMKIDLDDKTDVLTYHKKLLAEAQKEKEDLKAKVEKWHNSSKNLGKLLNTQMSANDKFGLGYGDHRYDGILSYENEVLQSVFMNKESELEKQPLYDRFVTAGGMHAVPPPMTGNYMPSGPDVEIDYSQFTYGPKQSQPSESETQTSDFDTCESECSVQTHESLPEPTIIEPKVVDQPKVWSDAPIIEEYESDSEDEHVSQHTKRKEQPSFASTNKQVKTPRETVQNQFTHSKNPRVDKKGLGYGFTARACFKSSQREIRPIWNNVQRVNHKNQFVPTAVLTRIGKIPVNTARASGTNNVSTARRDFNRQAVPTNAAVKVNIVKPILVLLGEKGKLMLSPQQVVIRDKKDITGKISPNTIVDQDYPYRALKHKGIVDSRCSRHMTGNKAYLAEYQVQGYIQETRLPLTLNIILQSQLHAWSTILLLAKVALKTQMIESANVFQREAEQVLWRLLERLKKPERKLVESPYKHEPKKILRQRTVKDENAGFCATSALNAELRIVSTVRDTKGLMSLAINYALERQEAKLTALLKLILNKLEKVSNTKQLSKLPWLHQAPDAGSLMYPDYFSDLTLMFAWSVLVPKGQKPQTRVFGTRVSSLTWNPTQISDYAEANLVQK